MSEFMTVPTNLNPERITVITDKSEIRRLCRVAKQVPCQKIIIEFDDDDNIIAKYFVNGNFCDKKTYKP